MDWDVFFDPFLMENPKVIDYDSTLPAAQATDPTTQYQHASGTPDVTHDASLDSPPAGPSHTGVDTSRLLQSPEIVESFPVVGPPNDSQEPLMSTFDADPGVLRTSLAELDARGAPEFTEITSIPQAARLMSTDEVNVNSWNPNMPDWDLTSSIARFEIATTVFDQPGVLIDSSPMSGTEASIQSDVPLDTDQAKLSDPCDLIQNPSLAPKPPRELQIEQQSQTERTSTSSLPRRRYALLRPKAPRIPHNIEMPVIGDTQGHWRPIQSTPVELEANYKIPSVHKRMRKRLASPTIQSSTIPKDCLSEFSITMNDESTVEEVQQSHSKRRQKSVKACLRCKLEKLRVSSIIKIIL